MTGGLDGMAATRAAGRGTTALGHRPGLDGLRAVAVAAVVVYHLWPQRLPGGFLGVDLFFVLSGFLITALLIAEYERAGAVSLRAFWRRRIRRLAPIALLTIGAVAIAAPLLLADTGRVASIRVDAAWSLGNVANWRFAWSAQTYANALDEPSPLQHLWSLAVEEQMYVVWPLVVLALARWRRSLRWFCASIVVVAAAGTALSVVRMAQLAGGDVVRAYYGTDTRAHLVLVGAIVAGGRGFALATGRHERWAGVWRRDGRARWGRALGVAPWSLWLVAMAAFVSVEHTEPWLYRGGFAALSIVFAGLVLAAGGNGVVARLLGRPSLTAVGRHSYAIYLWHWPVIVLVTSNVVGRSGAALVAVQLAITAALTVVSTRLVEAPVRDGRIAPRRTGRLWLAASTVVVAVVAVPSAVGHDRGQVSIRSTDIVLPPTPIAAEGALAPPRDVDAAPGDEGFPPPEGVTGGGVGTRPAGGIPPGGVRLEAELPPPPRVRVLVVGSDADVTERLAASPDVDLIDRSRAGCPAFPTVAVRNPDGIVVETAGCVPSQLALNELVVAARDVDVIVMALSAAERLPFLAHPGGRWSDDGTGRVDAALYAGGTIGTMLRDAASSGRPVYVVDSAGELDDHGVRSAVRHEALAHEAIHEATTEELLDEIARRRAAVGPAAVDSDVLRVVVVGDSTSFALADGLASLDGEMAVRWAGAENCSMVATTRVRWGPTIVFESTCPTVEDWARAAIGFGADLVVVLVSIPAQSEQEYDGVKGWHTAGEPAFVTAHDNAFDRLQRELAPAGILTLVADAPPVSGDTSQGGFRGSPMASPRRIAAWNEQIDTFVARWGSVGELDWTGPLLAAEGDGLAHRVDGVHLDRRSVEHLAPAWAAGITASYDQVRATATETGCLRAGTDEAGRRLDLARCNRPNE